MDISVLMRQTDCVCWENASLTDWQRVTAALEMPFNPPCPLVGTRLSPGPEL